MITIKIKEFLPGQFEAWEVQECKCGPDKLIITDEDKEELKARINEMYRSGQRTPTKIKFIE